MKTENFGDATYSLENACRLRVFLYQFNIDVLVYQRVQNETYVTLDSVTTTKVDDGTGNGILIGTECLVKLQLLMHHSSIT